ncbi:uncharacterized protein Fot_21496 [Forsythia ovata]|uniref:RNase H type-1 domain-containing protein n=1 Tax=Forsythia ovata TaxID=205694 RepID=A0ABD1UV01_9LAMI
MGDEKDAFYIVRRGNTVGVYKSLSDLQAVLRSSANDPLVSVFKGYGFSREAEEYLSSHGLKNAIYSVDARDVQDDLFGQLVTCPFRHPNSSKDKAVGKNYPEKRPQEIVGSASFPDSSQQKHAKLDSFLQVPPVSSFCSSCVLEFDGASKGNPGLAGAGAVLRAADGSMIQGLWKTKNQNMAELCKVAKELKDQFLSFQISHIERDFNTDADAQANLGRRFLRPTKIRAVAEEEETLVPEAEAQQETEASPPPAAATPDQTVSVPVSTSDVLTMLFQAEGAMTDSAIPTVTKALEEVEGVTDLKVRIIEGIASVELTKQTTVQATGVASNLVEIIQGSGFKLQTLNLSFQDEEDIS